MFLDFRKKIRKADYSKMIFAVSNSLPKMDEYLKVKLSLYVNYYFDDELVYRGEDLLSISTNVDLEMIIDKNEIYYKLDKEKYLSIENRSYNSIKRCIDQGIEFLYAKFKEECNKISYPIDDIVKENLTFSSGLHPEKSFEIISKNLNSILDEQIPS